MDEYRKYDVKVSDYKGLKKFHVTNNYFDKSDYAFYGHDGQLTSYSPYAADFVKRSVKGVEDILEASKVGHSYVIYTNGVHGEAVRYEDKTARQMGKTDIFKAVEKHKESARTATKDKPREAKKSKDGR